MGGRRFWLGLILAGCGGGAGAPDAPAGGGADAATPDAAAALTEFRPTGDTNLGAGTHRFAVVEVAAGVTVSLSGAATLEATGEVSVAGTLRADCAPVAVRAGGALTITGTLDNRCSTPSPTPGGLTLSTTGGARVRLGTLEAGASLETDGDLEVTNDPALEPWQFDLLLSQRPAGKTAPVCAASGPLAGAAGGELTFRGEAVDPDGGRVSYAWDFGDGGAGSGARATHTFAAAGNRTVTLTATDDEGERCRATVVVIVDDGEAPAARLELARVLVELGAEVTFAAVDVDAQADEVSFAWSFGDGATSTERAPRHTYAAVGRREVRVLVTDEQGQASTAIAAVYVHPAPPAQSKPQAGGCSGSANIVNPRATLRPAAESTGGASRRFQLRNATEVPAGATLQGAQGGAGVGRTGSGFVRGGDAGDGGDVELRIDGSLTFCTSEVGDVVVAGGKGGKGGDAVSTTEPPRGATAQAGRGGAGGKVVVSATGALSGFFTLHLGDGGDGGGAGATGEAGDESCAGGPSTHGADALAVAGEGGDVRDFELLSLGFSGGYVFDTSDGGRGGVAVAVGGSGAGGEACKVSVRGGRGGQARALGGRGGAARPGLGILGHLRVFRGGLGSAAHAATRAGGFVGATGGEPCGSAEAVGGDGGDATAVGGAGGNGQPIGGGGLAEADAAGASGGSSRATGSDCVACGAGGAAVASAGRGGHARARAGAGATAPEELARGGGGGLAIATGGKGGACETCPAGAGGAGGRAQADGGSAGEAKGRDAAGRNGGDAEATGGNGGQGASCCDPPAQGGSGGAGGAAVAVAGSGTAPGVRGRITGKRGGDGGSGGDGEGPGSGGAGGAGSGTPDDIPDGFSPAGGGVCGGGTGVTVIPQGGDRETRAVIDLGGQVMAKPQAQPARTLVVGLDASAAAGSFVNLLDAGGAPRAQAALAGFDASAAVAIEGGYALAGIAGSTAAVAFLDEDGALVKVNRYHAINPTSISVGAAPTPDGGLVLASAAAGSPGDAALTRLGPYGDVVWSRRYVGGGANDQLTVVRAIPGGGYIAVGATDSVDSDALILVVDDDGDLLRARTLAIGPSQRLVGVAPAAGGGFLVSGWTQAAVGASPDGIVFKLDAGLGVVWQRAIGNEKAALLFAIHELDDGVLVAGSTGDLFFGDLDALLAKVSPTGSLMWTRTYGTAAFDGAFSLWTEGDTVVLGGTAGTSTLVVRAEADGSVPGCADPRMGAPGSGFAGSSPSATVVDPGLSGQSLAGTPSALVSEDSAYQTAATNLCEP